MMFDDKLWETVSVGMYDSTIQCKSCGFTTSESIDATDEENHNRKKHECATEDKNMSGVIKEIKTVKYKTSDDVIFEDELKAIDHQRRLNLIGLLQQIQINQKKQPLRYLHIDHINVIVDLICEKVESRQINDILLNY